MPRAGLTVRECGAGGRVQGYTHQKSSLLHRIQGHREMQGIRDQAQLLRGRYRRPSTVCPRNSHGLALGNFTGPCMGASVKAPPKSLAPA